ncbi:uncharacterized protein LOC104421701 [Eucalyptus grandis]|uniref:Uncharacterized protein n=2 Tax=Eucalyptus grandis TaxID=71139 RepID=A0ACC3J3V7_EUCGR|nr:uncharacterized protein LOC104421701 [Eucalyptus grandis]XP_010032058.1 uncharacterized protein LOC104421701 [Eucalyptus grandis]KAK3408811.1 hypothetical protein EUGRSUZ_J00967 [Eucalyptus grandis]
MEKSRRQVGNSSSSSPNNTNASNSLDHLFGPKDSFSPSSGSFGSIFPPPSTVLGRTNNHSRSETFMGSPRNPDSGNQASGCKYENPGASTGQSFKVDGNNATSKAKSVIYQSEAAEPCYLSSSIYYGGQENYSPRTTARTAESHSTFKKDGVEDESNGSNLDSASRGNWWQGSLYY